MHVRIENREDPDQTASSGVLLLQKQSDLGVHCLSRPFWQATGVKILEHLT